MMFFVFVFCATINCYRLAAKFISLWFITRKCVAGKPSLCALITFFLSIMLLGALTSSIPGGRDRLEHPVRHL